MLPFQSNVGREIRKDTSAKTSSSGLNASNGQAREDFGSENAATMAIAWQKTATLFAGLEQKLNLSNCDIAAKFLRVQTAAENFVIIRQEVKALKDSVARQLEEQEEELETQKDQHAEELNELCRQLFEKVKENAQLKTEVTALSEMNSTLKQDNTRLLHELVYETEKCVMHQRSKHSLKHQLELAVDVEDYFEAKEENMRLQTQIEEIEGEKANLQSKVNELVQELTLKNPLVLVGAAIRLRFLEQAKEFVINKRDRPELNRELRSEGNLAAHYGNIIADESLFKLEYIPLDCLEITRRVFRELYSCYPDRRRYFDSIEIRLSNILAANRAHRRTESSVSQRKDLMEMYQQLQILQDSDEPSTVEISNHVTAIELITDHIIDLDLRTRRG
ncbi:uncharacterized protein EAE97_010583 [Botrytis byssoidea]|uniref:Uncharacterized protein n=1 Tax=Botrytis byssoidea TaxID=139641 RepID=A0A9P5HYN5_9HELO|nr:uncharacterized protein EAE97_010583 [Botrytis byssoidea]KAF7924632.1 hypothetical protein EAE97_010583 [Botrytis byssoidea]